MWEKGQEGERNKTKEENRSGESTSEEKSRREGPLGLFYFTFSSHKPAPIRSCAESESDFCLRVGKNKNKGSTVVKISFINTDSLLFSVLRIRIWGLTAID